MNAVILVIWTVVGGGDRSPVYSDWRPIGEFQTVAACNEAARQMDVGGRFRCLRKDAP